MPSRVQIIIPQEKSWDIFGGHCITITGEDTHHKGRGCLSIGQGSFSMLAFLPPATCREIAAALLAVADEIEPAKVTAPAPEAACPHCGTHKDNGHSEACPWMVKAKESPGLTCSDCGGTGINGEDVDNEGRPRVIDCKRCDGSGELRPCGTDVPGQQVAKFDGIKPPWSTVPCGECGHVIAIGDRESGPTHRAATKDAPACSRHAPF